MARNGSGVYSFANNSWNPAVNSVDATAADWNAIKTDIQNGLTQSVSSDGQTVMTNNFNMGGFKISNAANAVAVTDLVPLGQINTLKVSRAGDTMTGFLNLAQGTIAFNATTMDIWSQPNTMTVTGTGTLTALPAAPQAGASRDLLTAAGTIFSTTGAITVIGLPTGTYTTVAGDKLNVYASSTTAFTVQINKADGTAINTKQLQSITATQAAGALTLTTNPSTFDFRSITLTTGVPVSRTLAIASTLVVPSGATLGIPTGTSGRLIKGLLDNAGTLEEFVINLTGGLSLDETGLITTVAMSAGATSANVFYSNIARVGVAYKLTGFVDVVNTTGAYSNPTLVQGAGSQALAALSGLGFGQTWQDLTASRAVSTTYTNTTGKPISINVVATMASGSAALVFTITQNGAAITLAGSETQGTINRPASIHIAVIPNGASYAITTTIGAATLTAWRELR